MKPSTRASEDEYLARERVAVAKPPPADAKEVTVHYADGRLTLGWIPVRLFVEVMRALAKAKVLLTT